MVAVLLEALQETDPGTQDIAVVTSHTEVWRNAVDIDDPDAGKLSFFKVRLPYGIDVEAYIHEHDSISDAADEGDGIQWVVQRDAFEAFAQRIAEATELV